MSEPDLNAFSKSPHPDTIKVTEIGTGWFAENPGGLERVFYGLFEHFADVAVQARGLVAGSAAVAELSGGAVYSFAPPGAPLLTRWAGLRRTLRKTLREQRPDLIATHFALYTFPVLDLVRSYPLVIHFHGSWALESGVETTSRFGVAVKKYVETVVYRRATRFIVLSQAFKTVLRETYGVPDARIDVVPGGVDTRSYDTGLSMAEARAALGWPLERPILLAVRRLVKRQGLENLIAAVAELRHQHPDVLLFIAGQGPLKSVLEAQIQALGVGEHVRLLGFVPDDNLPLSYRAANLSVVPTAAHEGFGLITIESLAAGTPVMVTPVGGLPEALREFSPDLILPDSSAESLIFGIASVLTGTQELPTSRACQAYARDYFDYRTVAERTRQVYSQALQEYRGREGQK